MGRGTGDPLLKGKDWAAIRRYWLARRDPCHVCGGPIRYYPSGYTGPLAMDVGHIVSRDEAKAMGWTRPQINALKNTRPEHRECNRAAGARKATGKRAKNRKPIEQCDW